MPAELQIVIGTVASGKTEWLLRQYRAERLQGAASGSWTRSLWISPTARAADAIRDRLRSRGNDCLFAPGVFTFAGLAEEVVRQSGETIRPISRSMRRYLLRRIVAEQIEQARLPTLAAIAGGTGFIDLIESLISEWKRLEIWPEHLRQAFAARLDRASETRHGELVTLYEQYQAVLHDAHLYDEQGRFWAARRIVRDAPPAAFRELSLIVVDGFTDFTRTQHEILAHLAETCERMIVTLPLDDDAAGEVAEDTFRAELFAKPRMTLDELRRRHAGAFVTTHTTNGAGGAGSVSPVTTQLAANLFRGPRNRGDGLDAAPAGGYLGIVAAASPSGEIREVARRIKRRLVEEGLAADDIVVVDRQLANRQATFAQIFDEMGIPYEISIHQPLESTPWARSLSALLRLVEDDWPFASVLEVVTDLRICPRDCPAVPQDGGATSSIRVACERVVREMQIAAGRQALFRELSYRGERIATKGDRDETGEAAETASRGERLGILAGKAMPFFRAIQDALDRLGAACPLLDWIARLEDVVDRSGLVAGAWPGTSAEAKRDDRRSWRTLLRALRRLDQLESWAGTATRPLTRSEFLSAVRDVLASESAPRTPPRGPRVRLLTPAGFRGIRAEHVYVTGLTEQSFAGSEPANGLFGEQDYQRLADAGVPLLNRVSRREEEMLSFYEIATGANAFLLLSYAALDDRGQSIPESPMLLEVRDQFAPVEGTAGAPLEFETRLLERGPVRDQEPSSQAEWRIRSVADAVLGRGDDASRRDESGLAECLAGLADRVAAESLADALRIIQARKHSETFGWAEGMLHSSAARKVCGRDYGPQHVFSPSRLEEYSACPFHHFIRSVIRAEPLGELEIREDARTLGKLLHELLARVHADLVEEHGPAARPATLGAAAFRTAMLEGLDAILQERRGDPLERALEEVARADIVLLIDDYIAQHAQYDKLSENLTVPLTPAHYEVRFGPRRRSFDADQEDPLSTDQPFRLDLGDGGGFILLEGRVDRIDVGFLGDRRVCNVIDYKTGKNTSPLTPETLVEKSLLQVALYALATEQHLFGGEEQAACLHADYWWVRTKGFQASDQKSGMVLNIVSEGELHRNEQGKDFVEAVRARLRGILAGIRGGAFPVFNPNERCNSYCELKSVCRIRQIRNLEKVWSIQDPLADSEPAAPSSPPPDRGAGVPRPKSLGRDASATKRCGEEPR